MAEERRRRGYLDWMRGLAVLIMIEAHLIDSWTGGPDRETPAFAWAMLLGGMGAPTFLFLAGTAASLSAASKARSSGSVRSAARMVARRGAEIFALAFLFRVQALVLGWGAVRSLLKVDILNIMGPSIAFAAALWAATERSAYRAALFAVACAVTAVVTPIVHRTPLLAPVPDPLEAYLRPLPGLTNFAFFPWMGFVFAGALLGVFVDASRTHADETRMNIAAGTVGALVAASALALAYLTSDYASSDFWISSPAFFAVRVGVIAGATALAFAWESRAGGRAKWSPLRQLGRTSLFIYWIHVEMVYGLISLPLHKALTLAQASAALLAFALFMLACSVWKDRAVAWWRARRTPPSPAMA